MDIYQVLINSNTLRMSSGLEYDTDPMIGKIF